MPDFGTVVAVDYSAAATPSPARPSPDAPWVASATGVRPATLVGPPTVDRPTNHRTRAQVAQTVERLVATSPGPVLVGWDFGLGYPAGFAAAIGADGWAGVWERLSSSVVDGPDNRNNRFEVAAALNDHFGPPGPFWGVLGQHVHALAGRLGPRRPDLSYEQLGLSERRLAEQQLARAQPMFKLAYVGSVGSQSLLGIARLAQLRRALGPRMTVWPFQPLTGRTDEVVVAEIYPTMFTPDRPHPRAAGLEVRDAHQVLHSVDAMRGLSDEAWDRGWMPPQVVGEEGWVLGLLPPP